jgi:predicted TIM-barrel fold metal-dependent hydrolase
VLSDGTFVIDAVAHCFNLTDENFAHRGHAQAVTDMIYGVISAAPSGYAITEDAVKRDWGIEDTAAMLFHESATDVAIYHPTPIMAYKDGLSAFYKGVEGIKQWPNRFIGTWASVDPLQGKAAFDLLDEQTAALKDAGHTPYGLKLYPTSWRGEVVDSWRMDDPKIAFPLFERAAELGIKTIGVHKAIPLGPAPTGASFHPGDVEGAAEHFPELNFEIVHGGSAFCEETAWLLGRYPNIYVNMESLNIILAGNPRTFAQIMLGLMHVGGDPVLDRLFWATGTMQYHPRPCLEMFEEFTFPEDLLGNYGLFGKISQITPEGRAKILGLNVANYRGWDVKELAKNIEGDEFDSDDHDVTPYSTTSVADQLVSSNGNAGASQATAPVPAA